MKTIKPTTRIEETYTCDFCGREVNLPTATCFQCEKHTCNDACWYTHMRKYEGHWPARLEYKASYGQMGTGIEVPELYFCLGCDKTSRIAKLMREIEAEYRTLKIAFDTYRNNHHQMAQKVNRLIEKRQP